MKPLALKAISKIELDLAALGKRPLANDNQPKLGVFEKKN